jgi:hypothetical protein
MEIGFAKVYITPPILTCSNGGMYDKPTDFHLGVHDELYARALVFKDGDLQAAIVSADLINLLVPYCLNIKALIEEHCGIPPENVILHATHTHSGPFSFRHKQGIRNEPYWDVTQQHIAGAVYMAQAQTQEFFVGVGRSSLDYALNRRILMEDGKILYLSKHPGLKPNQPTDNELGVVSFRKLDRRPLITLMNYSCHPFCVANVPRQISADFPGSAVEQVEKRLFGSAIYTNGAHANIHPKQHAEGFEAMDAFGLAMAEKTLKVMPFIETGRAERLRSVSESVSLDLIPEKMDENEDIHDYRDGETFDFQITVIALNDIAFVAIPGEYHVELQIDIKKETPIKNTFLLTNSNGYVSYIPHAEAYDQGGYEVNSTKFQRGSGEKIRDKILELLAKVV